MIPGNKIPLRVILVEDSEFDAHMLVAMMRAGGYELIFRRVDDAASMRAALESGPWDLVLSDYSMPQFTLREALDILRQSGIDVPFIIVSAGIGEDTAVEAMKAGASDYIMKGNLRKLLPVIERELREAAARAARRCAESALRESELRYRLLCEHSPDVLLLIDVQGRIHFANSAVERFFGYSPEALVGQNLSLLQPESLRHKHLEIIQNVMRDRSALDAATMLPTAGCTREGREIPIEIAFRPLRLGNETRLAVFIRNRSPYQNQDHESQAQQLNTLIARGIQKRVLPQTTPHVPGIDLAFLPCPSDDMKGRYYEFITSPAKSSLIIANGTMPGSNLGFPLLEASACLHLLEENEHSISSMLAQANSILARLPSPSDPLALLLARIDMVRRSLTFANGGYGPAALFSRSGKAKLIIEPQGAPLGLSPKTQYSLSPETAVDPGDVLVFLPLETASRFASGGDSTALESLSHLIAKEGQSPLLHLVQWIQESILGLLQDQSQPQDLAVILARVQAE